jgi:hypothetical protein
VVEKVREVAISKQTAQKFNVEIYTLRKLNELGVSIRTISDLVLNSSAALKNLSGSEHINRTCGEH